MLYPSSEVSRVDALWQPNCFYSFFKLNILISVMAKHHTFFHCNQTELLHVQHNIKSRTSIYLPITPKKCAWGTLCGHSHKNETDKRTG